MITSDKCIEKASTVPGGSKRVSSRTFYTPFLPPTKVHQCSSHHSPFVGLQSSISLSFSFVLLYSRSFSRFLFSVFLFPFSFSASLLFFSTRFSTRLATRFSTRSLPFFTVLYHSLPFPYRFSPFLSPPFLSSPFLSSPFFFYSVTVLNHDVLWLITAQACI
jgi:hypothetical protein